MAPAQVLTIEDLILGRSWPHMRRGNGVVIRVDRKPDADKETFKAYAIQVKPIYPDEFMPTYWQTLYIDLGE